MSAALSAADIRGRFESERDYIRQYVEFLTSRSEIDDGRLFDLQRTLRDHGLANLYTRLHERLEEPFSQEEIDALLSSIDKLTPAVRDSLAKYELEQASWQPLFTTKGTVETHPDLLSEWVNYLFVELSYLFVELSADPTPEEIAAVRKRCLCHATQNTDRAEDVTDEVLSNVIDDAIERVLEIRQLARSGSLQNVLDHFDELRLIARVSTPVAEINVLRQGFILLMTAFDAAIFDLLRVKFRADFFSLIGDFAKDDKVALKEIAQMEASRPSVIGVSRNS